MSGAMALRTTLARALSSASLRYLSTTTCRSSPSCSPFVSPRMVRLARTHFFGNAQGLRYEIPQKLGWNPSRQMGARAKIKRRKDSTFDNIIQREKKLKIVSKIKEILVKQPGRTMTLLSLGKHRKSIGLTGRRRVIALLNRFPAVFEVYEEGCNLMCVRFTEEAERLYEEEEKIKEDLEVFLVEKLRKLVMMSIDKRLTLDKIAHIRKELGLPDDFKTSILPNYPQYFKVVETGDGPALELTFWDPLLAVSAAQRKAAAPVSEDEDADGFPRAPKIIIDGEEIRSTAVSSKRLNLPKGVQLSKKDRVVALKFQQIPYQSPYDDASTLDPASVEAEKRACAVVHELLSLTLEKKTLVDHLTHFKKDYKFSQRIRALLIRHPEMFYVSFKGQRDSVFLREAYRGSELIEKDPLVVAKERLAELVAVSRQSRMREQAALRADGTEIEEGDDDYEDDDDEDYESEDEDDEDDEEDDDNEDAEARESVDEGKTSRAPSKSQKRVPEERPATSRPRATVSSSRPRPVEVDEFLSNQNRVRERW